MAQHFADRLVDAVKKKATPVLVGLDPRWENLPSAFTQGVDGKDRRAVAEAFRLFSRGVIDVVTDLVAVVKPQAAFFEQLGPAGMVALADVMDYARSRNLLVILDGKRNDIGTTAAAYADAYLGAPPSSGWGADALTVSPYLGDDSISPFVQICQERAAGIFVLVKTSNPGGKTFQDLVAAEKKLYQHVAAHVEKLAKFTVGTYGYGAVGAVVGATYPEQLVELRKAMPHTWLLIPGYGAQGGTAQDVDAGFDENGLGAVVNNSRGIIFAHSSAAYREKFGDARWQDAVAAATRQMIDELRAQPNIGKLR